jgi:hypothetical protein
MLLKFGVLGRSDRFVALDSNAIAKKPLGSTGEILGLPEPAFPSLPAAEMLARVICEVFRST